MAKADLSTNDASSGRDRKSKWMSFIATGGLIAVIVGFCLCGGLIYQQWPAFQSDSAAAGQLTSEILDITVPDVFTPEGTIRWNIWMLLTMQGAYYTLTTGDGELSFLEVDSQFIDNDDFRQHIIRSLREHGAGGGFDLDVSSSQTQTFNVAGETITFTYLKAKDRTTGTDRRLVDGIVPGKTGPVLISLWVDEENWDPQMVETMIESIGTE